MRQVLKIINSALQSAAAFAVSATLLFSGYMIWDNSQVYTAAKNVQISVHEAKPVEDEDGKYDFEKLRSINRDVKLWITLDGTEIDGPVVQGRDNLYYLNCDVFGRQSMAGALYLDSRNDGDFSDIYNIIYGHHMKGSLMFGDLDDYMKKDFFDANTTGTFLLPDGAKKFETLAVMKLPDSTANVFRPSFYLRDLSGLCSFLEENASNISAAALAKLKAAPGDYQVTALVTCTDGRTGTRLVLLVMNAYDKPADPPGGHEWETGYRVDREPTCTEPGSKSIHCKNCGEIRESVVLPALGHKWDGGRVIKQATETEDGEIVYTCVRCGEERHVVIPAKNNPETGDRAGIALWLILSSGTLCAVLTGKRRHGAAKVRKTGTG